MSVQSVPLWRRRRAVVGLSRLSTVCTPHADVSMRSTLHCSVLLSVALQYSAAEIASTGPARRPQATAGLLQDVSFDGQPSCDGQRRHSGHVTFHLRGVTLCQNRCHPIGPHRRFASLRKARGHFCRRSPRMSLVTGFDSLWSRILAPSRPFRRVGRQLVAWRQPLVESIGSISGRLIGRSGHLSPLPVRCGQLSVRAVRSDFCLLTTSVRTICSCDLASDSPSPQPSDRTKQHPFWRDFHPSWR